MTIFSRHPYSLLFSGAGIVLLTIVLSAHYSSVPPTGATSIGYVQGGSLPITPLYVAGTTSATPPSATPASGGDLTLNPSQQTAPAPQQTVTALIAASSSRPILSANTSTSAPDLNDQQLLQEVYSLQPTGISMPVVASHPASAEDTALHDYGNEAGLAVLSFANADADMAEVLNAWLTNRADASAAANVKKIASDLIQAGQQLEAIPSVPTAAASANESLAKNYEDAGAKLQAVILAGGSDNTLLTAMETYDTSADSFTKNYISLTNVFALHGVTFGASEAGSVFQFPASGAL